MARSRNASETRPRLQTFQIQQSTVNQLGIFTSGTRREMTLLDQSEAQVHPSAVAAQSQVPRDARPVNAAAQNQNIELTCLKARQIVFARGHLVLMKNTREPIHATALRAAMMHCSGLHRYRYLRWTCVEAPQAFSSGMHHRSGAGLKVV